MSRLNVANAGQIFCHGETSTEFTFRHKPTIQRERWRTGQSA